MSKLRKIGQIKLKTVLIILAGIVFVLVQVPLIEAYEAHVINVTARIVQPCDEYYILGYKFFDANQNGIKDEGEQGLAGWIIELEKIFDERYDYNSDGVYTPEDIAILTDVANNLIDCPEDKKCHWNNDGWVDMEDVGLFEDFLSSLPIDLGNTITDQNGYYEFRNLEPGIYVVNEVQQSGWTPTTPTQQIVTLSYSLCIGEVNFGNYREGNNCPAFSIGYWQNHEGCPDSSNWTSEINSLSSSLQGAFATISGPDICYLLAPKNCPKGGTLEGQLCRAQGKALGDELNVVSGNLDLNAVIAGADNGNAAFDNLGLNANSTIIQSLNAIESILVDPNHTKAQLTDAAYVAERIYSFYEDENPQFPYCLYFWQEPECEVLGSMISIPGCTDEAALNYDSEATEDDGSCQYPEPEPITIPGCTDEAAQNYNPKATEDDGSCKYKEEKPKSKQGCMDPEALNYNPEAKKDDGSCTYPEPTVLGCTDETALNYNAEATEDDGTCEYEPVVILGCTDETALNYNPDATKDDESCQYPVPGCTDETALNFNSEATEDDGTCQYPVLGCMDETALNYNPEATKDDGSCLPADLSSET